MKNATEKQKQVINRIEQNINVTFTGRSINDASIFINRYMEGSKQIDRQDRMEDDALGYSLPNQ